MKDAIKGLIRTGCVVAVSACALAACSAAPVSEQEVDLDVATTATASVACVVSNPVPEDTGCNAYTTANAQRKATDLFAYVLGNDAKAPPTQTSLPGSITHCAVLKDGLDKLRAGWQSGQLTLGASAKQTVCGLPAAVIRISTNASTPVGYLDDVSTKISHVSGCQGYGVRNFLVAGGNGRHLRQRRPHAVD